MKGLIVLLTLLTLTSCASYNHRHDCDKSKKCTTQCKTKKHAHGDNKAAHKAADCKDGQCQLHKKDKSN